MDWPSDPWVKASYSFPAPGQVTTQGPTFRQGLGRLHFAGEYTSYAFMGYMEGALNSGAAVARRIAVKDGVVKDVTIISGPRVFHAAVRQAMLRYKCTPQPGEVLAIQEFVFKIE